MEQALREAGYRITRQRKAVLEYLCSTHVHPSARRVFQEAQKISPGLSLATVYNTLAVLVRRGLIKVMEFEASENRYDPNVSPHINLICTVCGRIQDLEQGLPVSPERVKEETGFQVYDHSMEYYGMCKECAGAAHQSMKPPGQSGSGRDSSNPNS